jgi:hypothetical protein
MELEFVHETHVSRPETFAWMTDYTEADHRGPRWGLGAGRTIVSRSERLVELETEWRKRVLRESVSLDPPAAWHIQGRTRGARWDVTHLLEDLPTGGCRMSTRYRMEGEGAVRLMLPFLARGLRKSIDEDLRLHIEDMEEQLGVRSP